MKRMESEPAKNKPELIDDKRYKINNLYIIEKYII